MAQEDEEEEKDEDLMMRRASHRGRSVSFDFREAP